MTGALLLLLLLQAAGEPQRAPSVRVRLAPETPAVGEPITVDLRVRAPRGTLVRFPVLPDTGGKLEPLDPRTVTELPQDGDIEWTATYRLIAWDTGSVALPFGDVTVEQDGRLTRYPVAASLHVRSLLPRDSAQRQPRPAREPLEARTWPWRWVVGAVVVLALALWARRRWRAVQAARAALDPGPGVRVRDAFTHLTQLDLAGAGEPGRHALAAVQALRRYVEARWPALPVALTATELAARLPSVDFPVLPERLVALVTESEGIAYAQVGVTAEHARRMATEAQAIANDCERAYQARQAQAAAASKVQRRRLA